MRFIHIADLHLGSSPEAEFLWGKNRAEEIWDSFAAVIDACNEKEIDLLLIAGDLFDPDLPSGQILTGQQSCLPD